MPINTRAIDSPVAWTTWGKTPEPTQSSQKPSGGFGNIQTRTVTSQLPKSFGGNAQGFQQNSALRSFAEDSYTPNPKYSKPTADLNNQPIPKTAEPSAPKTPQAVATPRPKTVPVPTPKTVNVTPIPLQGLGVGAALGAGMALLSGGDPLQGAVQGASFAVGSTVGTALLTGVAVAAGITPVGLGAIAIGIGGGLIGLGASQFSGFLYQKAKEGLGFKDPAQIPDTNQVNPIHAEGGGMAPIDGSITFPSPKSFRYILKIRITFTAWGSPAAIVYYYRFALNGTGNRFLAQGTRSYSYSVGSNGGVPSPQLSQYNTMGSVYNNATFVGNTGTFTLIGIEPSGTNNFEGTVSETATLISWEANSVPQNKQINITNNTTINYNYGSPPKTDNLENSPLLNNKTPVITPSKSQKLTPKANGINPQNNQEKGIIKKQDFVGPDGSSWTLAKLSDGTTVVSNFSGNANILNNSEFKKSLEHFNKNSSNNQSKKNSTGAIYQKEVEGEKITSDNQPNIINTANLPNPSGIVNQNNPTPNNNLLQSQPQISTPTQGNKAVASVVEKQQEQGEKDFNAVVNPVINSPVPESKQDQDYLVLLENQNNLISMIALGAGATYLATQFAQLNSAIASQPTPTPCQWPTDRTTVLNNQASTNTTLGVVTNTQLVNLQTTTNTINATTSTTATNLTNLIGTIGTATSTATNTLFGFVTKSYKSLYLDRVYNALSILLQVHNTAMLSRNVGESIGYLLSSSLSIFGIKDENGSPLDIGEILGDTVTNFIKGILGEELYNGLSTNWKKLSAIYTAVINIYDLILQNLSGIAEGLQIVGEYSGKIGNALKKGGVVLENAYEWMEENIRIKTGRLSVIERINENLESVENITSNLTEVTEIVSETGESVSTINEEVNNIKAQVNAGEQAKAEAETASKTASQSPEIANGDLITPEPD